MESNSSTTPNPLVKAAALAWYKHAGAGMTPPSPRPSGHLLVPCAAASPKKTPPSSPAVTLLDKYEIEWITTQLERLICSSSSSSSSSSLLPVPYSGEEPGDRHQVRKKRSHRKLFGLGSRYGRHATMLCGSVRDVVVETTSKKRATNC